MTELRNLKKIYSNIQLDHDTSDVNAPILDNLGLGSLRKLRAFKSKLKEIDRNSHLYFHNPQLADLVFCYLAAILLDAKFAVGDLILSPKRHLKSFAVSYVKSLILRRVQFIVAIHKFTQGYEREYGLDKSKFKFVPFKPNNSDLVGKIQTSDKRYILACGASYRDYVTLVQAVTGEQINTLIVCSDLAAAKHEAAFPRSIPKNVSHINKRVSRDEYNKLIANATLVVVPIQAGVLQPAGISVCFEAMAFGKAVIITAGSSSIGLVDDSNSRSVPEEDPIELRNKIRELWQDKSLRERLGRNAQSYAKSLGNHERFIGEISELLFNPQNWS